MPKKEQKEKKQKPLEKMTTKELKEIALEISGISGVHGMNKDELLSVIREDRGIVEEEKQKKINVREIKSQIQVLKAEKEKALEAKDKKQNEILRRKISKLKKKTRRAA